MANPKELRLALLISLANGIPIKEDIFSKGASTGTWSDASTLATKNTVLLNPEGKRPTGLTNRAFWRKLQDQLYAHLVSLDAAMASATESEQKEHRKRKVLLETRRIRPNKGVVDFFGYPVYKLDGSSQEELDEFNSNERRLIQGMLKIWLDLGKTDVLTDLSEVMSWGDFKLLADFNAQSRAVSHYSESLERQKEPQDKDHEGKIGVSDSQKQDVARMQGLISSIVNGFKEIDTLAPGGKQATLDDEAILKLKSGKHLVQVKNRTKLIAEHPAFEAMRSTGDLEELARLIAPDYKGPNEEGPRDAASPETLLQAILGKGLTSKKLADKKSQDYNLPIDPDDLTRQETIVDWLHQRPAIVGGHLHSRNVQIQGARLEKRLSRRVATITGPAKGDARLLVFLFFGALVFGEVGLGSGNNIFGSGMDLIRWAIVLGLLDAMIAILVANFVGSWSVGSNRWFFWIGTAGLILVASVLMWRGSTAAFDDYNQRGTQLHQTVPGGTIKPSFKFP